MTDADARQLSQHRGFLTGLAYRMLGEVAEAEDVVQDAYLRWRDRTPEQVDNPRAYLARVVTRLCLDRLKEARRRRETYVGAWLPEPLLESQAITPATPGELAEDVSFALMLALERLSPLERAAFLLHDVFDLSFDDVADALGRTPAACRQLASRARAQVHKGRPRFAVQPDEGERLTEAFFAAARSGDVSQLHRLLMESAILHSDGGGRKPAALRPIYGLDKICRFFAALARKSRGKAPLWRRNLIINGLPGFATVEHDGTLQTTALEVREGRVCALYVMRNPEKLRHLLAVLPEPVRRAVR